MIVLLLSVICSSLLSIVMRFSEGRISSRISMLAANYLTCMLMAVCYMGGDAIFPAVEGVGKTLGLGAINGVFYMLGLVLNQYNIQRSGVVLPSVFSKMGALLVPLVVSILVFREMPTVFQGIGFVLSVAAILLINHRKGGGGAIGRSNMLALFAFFLVEGVTGMMSKIFNEMVDSTLSSNFLFFTFSSAFILCIVLAFLRKERPGKRELLYGVMIGVPNFLASRFLLVALEQVPAVIVYPARSVGTIILITLAGVFFFKERLNRYQTAAMAVILVSLVLLNLS